MSYVSTANPNFCMTLKSWLETQSEILVLIRYSHSAGAKDFEFHNSFEALSKRLTSLPGRACVTAFKQRQLPIRGVVDNDFIAQCLNQIPEGSEYLVLDSERTVRDQYSHFYWTAGETHAELREELLDLRNRRIAVGMYPPWLYDNEEVISGVMPDENGETMTGAY